MIKAIYVTDVGCSAVETTLEKIHAAVQLKPRLLWLDITIERNEFSDDEIALLSGTFNFHELSIEDCLFPQYHPKVEEFDNYIFVALHGIRARAKDLSDFESGIYELDILLGRDYLVTVHAGPNAAVDTLFEKARFKPQIELKTRENLLFNLFQQLVSTYEAAIGRINDTIDEIEDKVLRNPSRAVMSEILDLKKLLLHLRKITEPQKNVYGYFSREGTDFISERSIAYFRDIAFRFENLTQSISSFNQIIGSVLEVYVSSVTLKTNEGMKFLTVIATLFMPPMLIASYYGMNLPFPEVSILGINGVWYLAAAVSFLSTFIVYLYLRRQRWFKL